MRSVALDADVLIKLACYGLLKLLEDDAKACDVGLCLLGVSRFTVRGYLAKRPLNRNINDAQREFERFSAKAERLEPTDDEAALAADFESAAQAASLPLDPGESQLAAIVTTRSFHAFITGDKRAVRSFEIIAATDRQLALRNSLICLEQLFLCLLSRHCGRDIRALVCAEPTVDKTLTICFACQTANSKKDDWIECLRSHVADLSKDAPSVLTKNGS